MNGNVLSDLTGNTVQSVDEKTNSMNTESVIFEKYNSNRPFVVAIEGNIGSGKSTMINYFKDFKDIQIHPEPVEKWYVIQSGIVVGIFLAWGLHFHSSDIVTPKLHYLCRQDLNGQNLLEKLYTNPQRWSFQFQSYIQLTRLQELKAPMKDGAKVRLLERSIQSNKYCFIELAKNNKDLCNEEATVLEKW